MTVDIREKEIQGILSWAVVVASSLMAAKLLAVWQTHSVSLLSSAVDSLFDIGISTINLFAARHAAKPPDDHHAYGHGKIESLAGLFQSVVIGLSGCYLVYESAKRWIQGSLLSDLESGINVLLFSLFVNAVLVFRLRRLAKKHSSIILRTESLHFSMDFLTMGSVVLVLIAVQRTSQIFWDPLLSILITLYIFYSAFKILRKSVDELLDRSLPEESILQIEALIRRDFPSISSWHRFRSRRVGDNIFLDFHIVIRDESDFRKAHDLTERLILAIQTLHPGADITVHYDPEGEE